MRAVIIAVIAVVVAGCQTEAGEKVAKFSAEAINKYCASSEGLRQTARENVSPYLDEGIEVKIQCPGDTP